MIIVMAKRTGVVIIVIILFILLIIGGVLLYLNKEKWFGYNQVPEGQNATQLPQSSLYLRVFNAENKDLVVTNYIIKNATGSIVKSGITKNNSYENVPNIALGNYSIVIYKNGKDSVDNKSYYVSEYDINFDIDQKVFDFNVSQKAKTVLMNTINVNGKTEIYLNVQNGKFRKGMFCIAYHTSIYNPSFEGLQRMDIPADKKMQYDRCYDIGYDIVSDYKTFKLNYTKEISDAGLPILITVFDKGFDANLQETYNDPDIPDVSVEIRV